MHYLISLLIVAAALIPFFVRFEGRRPDAREVVLLVVFIALAVVGRMAFFMVPQFKPVAAIVIVAGVALGKENGLLVGACAAFLSNFIFGQGIWTPYQMLGFGLIGFSAGALFHRGRLPKRMWTLLVFGFAATLVLYGLVVDTSSVLFFTPSGSLAEVLAIYIAGVPFNVVHAVSTVVFLLVLARPLLRKVERVRVKYGIDAVDVGLQ